MEKTTVELFSGRILMELTKCPNVCCPMFFLLFLTQLRCFIWSHREDRSAVECHLTSDLEAFHESSYYNLTSIALPATHLWTNEYLEHEEYRWKLESRTPPRGRHPLRECLLVSVNHHSTSSTELPSVLKIEEDCWWARRWSWDLLDTEAWNTKTLCRLKTKLT